jgi:hypothetical protein
MASQSRLEASRNVFSVYGTVGRSFVGGVEQTRAALADAGAGAGRLFTRGFLAVGRRSDWMCQAFEAAFAVVVDRVEGLDDEF